MKRLLVTNDDGYASPALAPLPHAMRALGDVRALVPDLLVHGLPEDVDVLSVNFPESVTDDTPRAITRAAPLRYAGLFRQKAPGSTRTISRAWSAVATTLQEAITKR